MINVGAYGKNKDDSIMVNSKFYQRIKNGFFKLQTEIK